MAAKKVESTAKISRDRKIYRLSKKQARLQSPIVRVSSLELIEVLGGLVMLSLECSGCRDHEGDQLPKFGRGHAQV